MVMMYKPSMVDAPSGRAPEQAPRWDLVDIGSYSGGIRVLAPYLIVWGYVGIYRRKKYVSGATGAHEGGGRAWGVGAPPTSWPPPLFLDVGSKSPGSCSVRKSRSQRFHSVWNPFDIPFLRNLKISKKTAILGWASG